ncbi:MAG: tRNA dihydrouridine synthase DusB [Melioribacteraceae bacterium]|jgi:tRNA-dihydrouridine synthase B|nr:tRNA dihydrouridine synthase DusB [Melioribacteraceae bacterium]
MKIGNIDIGNKLILAPMAEITDSSFRKICKQNGVGLTYTQMVSALGIINNNFETLRLCSFSRDEKPIGVQILGNDPDILGQATKELSKLKPDVIDVNCGCPADKVVGNNFGSALLDDPRTIGLIVRKMVDLSNGIPISVKLRIGKDRNHVNIMDTAKVVVDNGGSILIIHGRAREDKYDVDADWSWIKKIKDEYKIVVVGNGSIFTPQDALKMINETGCDSVMVARGALGNPFIFSRFNSLIETGIDPGLPTIEIVTKNLIQHINYLEQEFGEFLALDKAKKHTIWYLKDYPGIDDLLAKIFSLKNLEFLRELVNEHSLLIENGFFKSNGENSINKKFQKKVLFWLADEAKA